MKLTIVLLLAFVAIAIAMPREKRQRVVEKTTIIRQGGPGFNNGPGFGGRGGFNNGPGFGGPQRGGFGGPGQFGRGHETVVKTTVIRG